MGLQLSLITCVDFPGVERQKPLVSRQDLQQEFCAKGKGLVVWLSSVFCYINVPVWLEEVIQCNQNRQDLEQGLNWLIVYKIRAQFVHSILNLVTICFCTEML